MIYGLPFLLALLLFFVGLYLLGRVTKRTISKNKAIEDYQEAEAKLEAARIKKQTAKLLKKLENEGNENE